MGLAIAWLIFALLVAFVGVNKSIGYWGAFGICLITSPLLGLIICLCIPDKPSPVVRPEYKCKHCELIAYENSHYCPRCGRDLEGFTLPENQERFKTKQV